MRETLERKAREFYDTWSSEPIDGPWTTDEIMDYAAAFARKLLEEAVEQLPPHQHVGSYCHWCECKKKIMELAR